MFPDTLLGVVVFSAAAGPGYLYVRLSRTREPHYERSSLEEAAEFVVFGSLSSSFGILLTLAIGFSTGLLDKNAISTDATQYILLHPFRVLVALACVISLSYGVVWIVTTQLLHRGKPSIWPGETAWYAAFKRMLPGEHGSYVTVELRDGRSVAGLVAAYTPDNQQPREVLLVKPEDGSLWVSEEPGAEPVALPDSFIVLQDPDIFTVSGRYVPTKGDRPKRPKRIEIDIDTLVIAASLVLIGLILVGLLR